MKPLTPHDSSPEMPETPRPAASERWGFLFPTGVRLWHFIILPPLSMAAIIAVAHWIDRSVAVGLGPVGVEIYSIGRAAAISLLMASLIAWLAFRHRREYESKLTARNRDLERTRDFLSSVIEGSAEAIVTLDPKGRVTSWNRSAERIYGWSAEEMLGRDARRVAPPELVEAGEMDRIERKLASGSTLRDYETDRIRKDGRRITVRLTRSPLYDAEGHYIGSTGIVRDVTALKDMEAKLLEAERLAAVGELAASIAHEIKNPLAGIRGACEILGDGFDESDPKKELASEVLHQIDRLDRTVKDLLLFARPQQSRPEPTDIHAVLRRVLNLVHEDLRNRDVNVRRSFLDSMPELHVDPQQMEQVFLNILLNAFQAMDFRGDVVVATGLDDGHASVRFRDSGPGIPEEVLGQIFKPFFTTRSKGTGLGLAIVKNIVAAHGGSIDAANHPEGGAEFTVHLPTRVS